jgi:hypothetical protein
MSLPRALALASVLALAGLIEAAAQFPPPPGQASSSGGQSSPFPPPPGAGQSNPFPPPPGQSRASPSPSPPPAAQQSGWPSGPGQANQAPAGGSPFAPPGAPNPMQPGASSICEQFPNIRGQAEKDASAIKAASDRKATREEVCAAFNKFMASEGRMVKFLETNRATCGVPPDAIKQVKTQHARTVQIRKQVCSAGPAPQGPSLSDALGAPIISSEPPKPGRGTFDTLTGSPLAR